MWLASYPRSGNTFFRIILNQCFGIKTASVFKNDLGVFENTPDLVKLVGHIEIDQIETKNLFVKTHYHPVDDEPAIYILRDGRSTLVSCFHFLRDLVGEDVSMEAVISGNTGFGSWSEHAKAWDPINRNRTLLIKYEEMISDIPSVIEKVSDFIGTKPSRKFGISFDSLKEQNRKFFRTGENLSALIEIDPYLDLFEKLHGNTMKEFGYY